MAKTRFNRDHSLSSIIKKSGALEIFGDDFEGRAALLGFLNEFSEGKFGDPEDFNVWMDKGKSILGHTIRSEE